MRCVEIGTQWWLTRLCRSSRIWRSSVSRPCKTPCRSSTWCWCVQVIKLIEATQIDDGPRRSLLRRVWSKTVFCCTNPLRPSMLRPTCSCSSRTTRRGRPTPLPWSSSPMLTWHPLCPLSPTRPPLFLAHRPRLPPLRRDLSRRCVLCRIYVVASLGTDSCVHR